MNKIKLFLLIVLFSNLLKADVYVYASGLPKKQFTLGVEGDILQGRNKFQFVESIQALLLEAGIKYENEKIIMLPNIRDGLPILITAFTTASGRHIVDVQEGYLYKFSYNKADGLKFISAEPYNEKEEVEAAAKK